MELQQMVERFPKIADRIAEMKSQHPRAYTAPKVLKRNRHTGRVNAYKQAILSNRKAERVTTGCGKTYAVLPHVKNLGSALKPQMVKVSQIVRVTL